MSNVLRELIRLQELEFAFSEKRVAEGESTDTALAAEVQRLHSNLPGTHSALFRQLRSRDLAVVVALHNGACSGCGMAAPTAQAQAVRTGNQLQQCRSCHRILFYPEHLSKQHRRGYKSMSAALRGPRRFSHPSLMLPDLRSKTRDGALSEMVDAIADEGLVKDPGRLVALALRREEISSTALESGLAFPHVRGVEGGGMVFGLGLSREGVLFDPASEQRTFILVLTIIPAVASSLYLRLIADLLRALRAQDAQSQLRACTTKAVLWRTLGSLTKDQP